MSDAIAPKPSRRKVEGGVHPRLQNRNLVVLLPADVRRPEGSGPTGTILFPESLVELIQQIDGKTNAIILLHAGRLNEFNVELAAQIRNLPGRPVIAVLGSRDAMDRAVTLARHLDVGHVLPEDCLDFPQELECWIDWIGGSGPPSGLGTHLKSATETHRISLKTKEDKPMAIGAVLDFVEKIRHEDPFQFDVRLILEEALNNAIYHGFRDEEGGPKYSVRDTRGFDQGDEVEVRFGADSDSIAISIADNQGRLRRDTILEKLERHLNVQGLLDESGRGLYLIHSLAGRVIFNLHRGKMTEITVVFPLTSQWWEDASRVRPILIFENR